MTAPSMRETAFNCPHCRAYARQDWARAAAARVHGVVACPQDDPRTFRPATPVDDFWFAFCERCKELTAWYRNELVYPDMGAGPPPNPDLPEDVRADYLEAGGIVARSPRGAAALLRLCIQKLCKHLGESGQNINADVASLVSKGLSVQVQQALDYVRVIGNHAVHPGQIELRDDRETAGQLFVLVNLVADAMISQPKQVKALFDTLPQTAREAIARRDQSGPSAGITAPGSTPAAGPSARS